METGEMPVPIEQEQVSEQFDVALRIPVARYVLRGVREQYNSRLAELTADHSELGDARREDFHESDLARLVRDSVDRLQTAEAEKAEKVTLSLTKDDTKTIRDNSRPAADAVAVRLDREMFEEFNGIVMNARREAAKGVVAKTKVFLGF